MGSGFRARSPSSSQALLFVCVYALLGAVRSSFDNEGCNTLTYSSVPSCITICSRNCTFFYAQANLFSSVAPNWNAPYTDSCACEGSYCKSLLMNSCPSSVDRQKYESYLSGGCKQDTLKSRCVDCLSVGCAFCDRRSSVPSNRPVQNQTSFCFSDTVSIDPFFGACDPNFEDDILMRKSASQANSDLEETCSDYIDLPLGTLIIYIILYTFCPTIVCGAFWYSFCFGIPVFARKMCCCATDKVHVESNDDNNNVQWNDSSYPRPNLAGRVYVLPSDAVPATVSRHNPDIQTAVIVQEDRRGGSSSRDRSYATVQSSFSDPSDRQMSSIPIAYAKALEPN